MKKILAFLLLLTPFFALTQELSFPPGAEQVSRKKIEAKHNLLPGPQNKTQLSHSFDVQHYKLELDLYSCYTSPYSAAFNGITTLRFRADSVINSISLDAIQSSLIIDSVRLGATSFVQTASHVNLMLNHTLNPGQMDSVALYYHHLNVSDNAFWVSADGTVFTDCEPQGARKWFPCWDDPSDKASMELWAKTPASVLLGSNGVLKDSVKTMDSIRYHWVCQEPVATYLMVITSKKNYNLDYVYWHKISNPADSIQMRFYYNTGEDLNALNTCKTLIGPLTTYFSQLFCEHPFGKNGFATLNSNFAWGGMENQTLTSLCPNCWSEGLIVHEFGHQWFGDMITCATWSNIFLNEGFATYLEALWDEHAYGAANYKARIDYDANYYLNNNPGTPNANPQWDISLPDVNTIFNYAITYCKGAAILHQLRYVTGDSLFFRSLRSYCADTNLKYKSAKIDDLIQHFNQNGGQDYTWFFNEWLYQSNHPVYQIHYVSQWLGGNQWNINTQINQTQTNTGFYQMPVEFKVFFHDHTDTTIKVFNNVQNQTFNFLINKQADSLQFDPSNQIVLKQFSISQGIETFRPGTQNSFRISNNPVNEHSIIQISNPERKRLLLSFMDAMGKLVLQIEVAESEAQMEIPIPIEKLGSGFYVAQLKIGNEVLSKSFIIP